MCANETNRSLATTILAPAIPAVMNEFHARESAESSLLITVYVIGLATGPLFLAPLSELYGRCGVTHVANVVFLLATILAAVSVNVAMLTAFRFLMGLSCSVPATVGGGFIADLMVQEERGKAYTIWVIGPLLVRCQRRTLEGIHADVDMSQGPVLGPIMGGFISMDVGWRWTLWLPAIIVS